MSYVKSADSVKGLYKIDPAAPLLVLLLAFPISVPWMSGAAAQYIMTGGYIASGILALGIFSNHVKVFRGSWPTVLPFVLLISYMVAHLMVSVLGGTTGQVGQDMNEIVRIIGLVVFFLVGVAIGDTIRPRSAKVALFILGALLTYLLVAWVVHSVRTPLFEAYITRGGRFSGLGFAVNYVWAHILIMLGLLLYAARENKRVSSLFLVWMFAILLAYLLLSGSRTAILVLLPGVIYLASVYMSTRLGRMIVSGAFALAFILAVVTAVDFSPWEGQFDRTQNRVQEVITAYQEQDLARVPALASRVEEFYDRMDLISKKPIFGYGLGREAEPFFHSSYQRTAYRYGAIALILELVMYVITLGCAWRLARQERLVAIAAAFVLAYIPAGVVSLVWYELRVPYMLAACLGIVAAVYGREKSKVLQ